MYMDDQAPVKAGSPTLGCGEEEPGRGSLLERKLHEARTIIAAGTVSMEMAYDIQARVLAMEKDDPDEPITIFINSPGGHADSGFAIYDLLRFVKPPIRTVVNGVCASAAVMIFLGGDEGQRFTLPQSRFLIHQPSTMSQGSASDLEITAKQILKLRQRYNQIVAEASNRSEEQVLKDVDRDFWMDGAETVDYGLATKVITRREDL